MENLARAWAILGLKPGSSVRRLRRQYLSLVRRWHPDRFADDSAGQKEATLQLQRINMAYRTLLEASAAPGAKSHAPSGRRLSRDEIDRFVNSIGKGSPLEALFESSRYHSLLQGYKRAGNHWEITPSAAFLLVLVAGFSAILVLSRAGVDLSRGQMAAACMAMVVFGAWAAVRHRS